MLNLRTEPFSFLFCAVENKKIISPIKINPYLCNMAKAKKEDIKLFEFDAVNESLTDRQLLFCMQYIKCKFNGSEAAKMAGYSEVGAKEQASYLLTNPNIRANIEKYKADLGLRIGVDAEYLASTLLNWAESDITQTLDLTTDELKKLPLEVRRLITQIETKTIISKRGEEKSHTVKFVSKEKAMDMLINLLGYNKPMKVANTDAEGNDKDIVIEMNIK